MGNYTQSSRRPWSQLGYARSLGDGIATIDPDRTWKKQTGRSRPNPGALLTDLLDLDSHCDFSFSSAIWV
jgi:hypothetical protein